MGNIFTKELPKPFIDVTCPRTREEYEAKFHLAKVLPKFENQLAAKKSKILAHFDEYEKVSAVNGLPPALIACIHSLEGNLNFGTHLHNGDPLESRTVHVPKGRPLKGDPPFQWFESAIDALGGPNANRREWALGDQLAFAEAFNGWGYRKRNVPSPYLWSFTDQYEKGKYIDDGVYAPNVVSQQAGVVAILKSLGAVHMIVA